MKMTVSKKLFSGFIAVLLLLVSIAGLGYYEINSIDAKYSHLLSNRVDDVMLGKDITASVIERQSTPGDTCWPAMTATW